MKNRFILVLALVLLAFASVSMAVENLPQSEVDEIVKGVESGDAEAQLKLGVMYVNGQNVKQDYEQAFYWFRKSYEQGNVEAQLWVALAYFDGLGVEKDEAQAFKLMKQIAEKKPSTIKKVYGFEENGKKPYSSAEELIAAAKFFVGCSYFEGKGTKKDYEQAKYYFTKAAEHGSEHVKGLTREEFEKLRILQAQHSSSTTTTSKPQPSASESVIEINFQQAFKECRENGLIYKWKYDSKKVRVTEKIFARGTHPFDKRIFVRLSYKENQIGFDDFDDLYCFFEDSQADSVMKLKAGQRVTIEGTCEEDNFFPFTLAKCHIVAVNNGNNTKNETEHSSSQAQISTANNAVALSEPRNFDEAKGNAVIFLNSLEEVAEKLIATDTYNTQDIEVMPADEYREESETVYMRAWYNEKYFMFSNYANSPRPVACFRTYSPEHVFAGGIKVGSSFNEIRYLFGDFAWNAEDNTLDVNVDTSEANIHFNSGRVDYIEYNWLGAEYTHKMMNLLYLYRDDIREASVTTDSRLNVRDTNGTNGNILFQVTKQNNILFVDKDSSNEWYRVRFVYDKSANTISSVNEGYVMGKYINVEPLSYGDRQSLITVFSK